MIRTVHRLLYRSIVPPFFIALLILTFVLFFQIIGNRTELILGQNTSADIILSVVAAILPGILIYSLPLSYLIGILIGISGLSGESQITALRACGIPIRSLLGFILLFGLLVGGVTAVLSLLVMPRANQFVSGMTQKITARLATSAIKPRVFNEEFPNIVFYVDDVSSDRQQWHRVFLADRSDPQSPRTIIARYGAWIGDASEEILQLHLDHGAIYGGSAKDPGRDSISRFESMDLPVRIRRGDPSSRPPVKVAELDSAYLWKNYGAGSAEERVERLVELHKRCALPFAVVPFALLGLALAAGPNKGSRTSGFALSLMTVILFYVMFFNGLRLASVGKIHPFWGAWGADLLLLCAGIALLARVEHGFGILERASGLLWRIRNVPVLRKPGRKPPETGAGARIPSAPAAESGGIRFRFPRVFDFYVSRGFIAYFAWALISCCTLFVLLTLFDLLDDIIRNGISAASVMAYFTFLTPQILMIVVPVSVLLGILINFGIMEKNSEITAIKAGGWSLYRIAFPLFLVAAFFCCGLFLLQDYVLPYANVRQENIRNAIKGRPPQTSSRMQRKWIFGEAGRIYNYDYFDGAQDSFVNLSVYETDLAGVRILKRYFAARAGIDKNGLWILEDGYVRDFQSAELGFRRIRSEPVRFPERAGYFEREIFQPKESSKLRYLELKNYIEYLKKSGYNATELQVELHKKISFPLSCMIMALLAIPFSFSMGKKGAFYGIGISIAIAISFWGISGVFEAMGAYGLLVPLLAAWAPNILFGASGFALLFTIRT